MCRTTTSIDKHPASEHLEDLNHLLRIPSCPGFRVFRVSGSRFRVWGSWVQGFRAEGLGCKVAGLSGFGVRIYVGRGLAFSSFEFRVWEGVLTEVPGYETGIIASPKA